MKTVKLTVDAGVRDRRHCPVAVAVDGPGVSGLTTGDQPVAYQVRPAGDGQVELRFVIDRLDAGQTREYLVAVGPTPAADGRLAFEEHDTYLVVKCAGECFSAYHFAEPSAARPFWYPVPDPFGGVLSRGFPMVDVEGERQDHKHHRSLWVAYGDVNGSDNWSEEPGHGAQTHEGWHALEAGPVYALLDEQVCWRDNAGAPVLDERRVWRVYDLPASCRLIDLDLDLTAAAGVGDVRFGDTKEGGLLSLRVTTSMDAPRGRIENAVGGINEGETWGQRAHWCDYSGPVGGNWVGVAAFDHPTSFRHPTWWHVRNYGLMTANCFGLSHFTNGQDDGSYLLPAGQTLSFRYRVYLHAGDATQGDVATKWHDYAHPPVIKLS